MTLFVKGDRVVYLAHPPKTSGTSLTVMLRKAGWATHWHVDHNADIHPAHWTADRYQAELDAAGIRPEFYMLVRHPDDRMQSMYRRWCRRWDYDRWVNDVLDNGHRYAATRQVDYRPTGGRSFRLLTFERGVTANLHRIDPDADVTPVKRESAPAVPAERLRLTAAARERLDAHFDEDYFAFGYQPH